MTGYKSKRAAAQAKTIDQVNWADHEPNGLAQPAQELVAVYGYCPECGAKGVMRERRPNGNDKCANGHTYPSNTSPQPQPAQEPTKYSFRAHWEADGCIGVVAAIERLDGGVHLLKDIIDAPQRPWVDLTDEEVKDIVWNLPYEPSQEDIRAIEAKLREKNT